MHAQTLLWRERQSNSPLIASIWMSNALADTSRTVIADPCISILFVKDNGGSRVVVMGPKTKAYSVLLPSGYTCIAIRLKPGVSLKELPAKRLVNSIITFPADANAGFWFEGKRVQFPDFDHAELVVERLQRIGYLHYVAPGKESSGVGSQLSARTRFRQIQHSTGLSPYQLFQLRRVHQAFRLLKEGMPAAEVATELDFVDQSHLIRASKQFLGHTPRQLPQLPQLPWQHLSKSTVHRAARPVSLFR